jgi:hypothetical protein
MSLKAGTIQLDGGDRAKSLCQNFISRGGGDCKQHTRSDKGDEFHFDDRKVCYPTDRWPRKVEYTGAVVSWMIEEDVLTIFVFVITDTEDIPTTVNEENCHCTATFNDPEVVKKFLAEFCN